MLAHKFIPQDPEYDLDLSLVAKQVRAALDEDIGTGDITAALIPDNANATALIICKEAMVLCGRPWVEEVFRQLDAQIRVEWQAEEGCEVTPNNSLCTIQGNARAVLSGERTALNFLQLLSAIATTAREYANAVAGTGVRILDTRKTLPGLRYAQKYAVRCGGCFNHRLGLFDVILIKENHIQAAGSIAAALAAAQLVLPETKVEIEVESIAELHQALAAGAKRILLDNFSIDALRIAVADTNGRARLEASGSVNLDTVRVIAETGVDDISVGGLTKHLRAVDLSMRIIRDG